MVEMADAVLEIRSKIRLMLVHADEEMPRLRPELHNDWNEAPIEPKENCKTE